MTKTRFSVFVFVCTLSGGAALFAEEAATVDHQDSVAPCAACAAAGANDSGGCGCCSRSLVAGVEAVFLKPNIGGHDISYTDGANNYSGNQFADFQRLEASPRMWIGMQGPCWGIRGRYWTIDDDSHGGVVDLDAPTFLNMQSANACLDLHAYTVDLEVTRSLEFCNWSLLGSLGIRHAELSVDESFHVLTEAQNIAVQTQNSRFMQGTGLTGALEARKPLGDGGLALIGSLRGSVLWGQDRSASDNLLFTPGVAMAQVVEVKEDTPLYIMEFQVGLEWTHRLQCVATDVSLHAVFEYQRWTSPEATTYDYNQSLNNIATAGNSISTAVDFTGVAFGICFTR
ncbi:MAG: hypothetical protein ABSG68_05200 [Thermoguttaceae bacterium]|jgi:hypothetical protein